MTSTLREIYEKSRELENCQMHLSIIFEGGRPVVRSEW